MPIKILTLAIITSFSINTFAQTEQYDLLQHQAAKQEKNRSIMFSPHSELTRSARINNSKNVYVAPVLGTPQFFWANSTIKNYKVRNSTTQTSEKMHRSAGRHYINQYKRLLGLNNHGERGLKFRTASQIAKDKAIIVRYDQYVNDIPVLGGAVNLLMDKNHKLISVGANVAPQTRAVADEQNFSYHKNKAVAIALSDLIEEKVSLNDVFVDLDTHKVTLNKTKNGWKMSSAATVEKVYYPQKDRVLSAYKISLRVNKPGTSRINGETRHFGYVISATNGKILQRKNYSHSAFHGKNTNFSYLVYADRATKAPQDGPDGNNGSPHPTGIPDGFQAALGTQNMLAMSHAGINTEDPWLPAGATESKGNNVDAYIDTSAPDGFTENSDDLRAKLNGNGEFNYIFDATKDANANNIQKQAAVTNLFYTINYLHDVFYNAGFDEASGNAQLDNYGRGGNEGDPILAEGQDFSGINNANMSTPPDGQSPVMQQFLFQGSPKITFDFTPTKDYQLSIYPNRLGLKDFDTLTSVAVLMPDNDAKDICQPFTNGADFTDKVLVINHTEACDEEQFYKALSEISPAVVMIVNNATLPITFEKQLPYGVIDVDNNDESQIFIDAIKTGNITAHLALKSQMFRDSTLSNLVIMHEWGHYIHGRLAGNGQGPGNNVYGGGMGEGFGDFIAIMHQVREEDLSKPGGDNYNGIYTQGGWTDGSSVDSDNQAYYFGIRRVPYSTDISKNALSYRHFRLGETLPETHPIAGEATEVTDVGPHSQGEIWATVLFEAFMGLARDSDRLTLTQAKERMRQYLVSGLKLTPSDATYLLARDAIIASAVANDIKDAKIIAQAFAKRGMGTLATSPAVSSPDLKEGLKESFETTSIIQAKDLKIANMIKACDTDNIWDPTEVAELDISVYNSGIETLNSGELVIESNDKVTFVNGNNITHGELAPFAQQQIKVKVKLNEDADFNSKVTLSLASTAKPENKVDFSFSTNHDIGFGNVEAFEKSIDNEADKRFLNWTNTRELENDNLHEDIWFGSFSASSKSNTAKIWPYAGTKDESLESAELTVGDDTDFEVNFDHVYVTREGFAGGLIEVREIGDQWAAIDEAKITRYDLDGTELGKGYAAKVNADAGTKVDGQAAFSGLNITDEEMVNRKLPLRKVAINLGRDYAGKKVQVRFRYFSADVEGEANDFWELDNIEFKGLTTKVIDKAIIANAKICTDNTAPTVTLVSTGGTFANNSLAITTKAGSNLTLTAKGNDKENDKLTYKWEQTSGGKVILSDAETANLKVTIPESSSAGTVNFKVTVSDGKETVTSKAVVTVTKKKKSSGGAFSAYLLLIGLGARLFRQRKHI